MPNQSLVELLTGYAAAPFEYFGYGKKPPPRVGDAAVRSPAGFGFEDPEARAYADRQTPSDQSILRPMTRVSSLLDGLSAPVRNSVADTMDVDRKAGEATGLGGVPFGNAAAGTAVMLSTLPRLAHTMASEGINTADRWLSATHQLPGAKATDDLVLPVEKRGTEDYQINPNRVEDHDLLAPLGLAGMGNPVSALGRESLRAGAKVGRPSERAVLPPDISAKLNPQSHIDMSDEARLARAKEQGFNTDEAMYHGSNERFDAFQRDRSDMNEISGNYFTADRSEAATYGDNVGAYHLRMRKPIRLEMTSDGWRAMDKADADALASARVDLTKLDANKLTRALERLGYDGAEQWTRGNSGKMERFWTTVFDPKNIRSTRATFDPISENNPSLLLSDAGKRSSLPGMIQGGVENVQGNVERAARPEIVTPASRRVENPIKAYHGSPHDFDKFDSSKIGTGEGAQAFGHGLYFAEHPDTAKAYKENLTRHPAQQLLDRHDGDVDAAIRYAQRSANTSWGRENPDVLGVLEAHKRGSPLPDAGGRLYEVSLHAKPEEFLDWDLPLSKQSEGVRALVERIQSERTAREGRGALRIDQVGSVTSDGGRVPPMSGAAVYQYLNAPRYGGDASKALREAGITGIRYKDQGSRGKEGGTYNYVVFPGAEDVIEIIGKDGKPLQGAEKAKAVKELYAKQGMPVPGQEEEREARRPKGFGGPIPQQGPKGFGGPVPQ